ncbi:hypothetical protein ACFXJ8_03115 [Nonomuraea sp. NPDC059194]|uniref:hypothetical protein n=1 Tax=Nonomuraea sp. NPDC059194 TaxID=3346764 RepID=UPI00369D70BD
MILISAGLVLAAVVLLIAGFVMAEPFLIMWSIVVSVLSALFLVIGAFLRRHELFPGGGGAGAQASQANAPTVTPTAVTPAGAATAPTMPQQPPRPLAPAQPLPSGMRPQQGIAHGAPRPASAVAAAPRGISPGAIVLVIPGRKRYHVASCRQLSGREHEELTFEEAREEGFTPCTTCLPDAALGGRQVPPAAEPRQGQPAGRAPYTAAPAVPRDATPAGRPPVPGPSSGTSGASAGTQAAHGAEAFESNAAQTDPRPPAGVSAKPPAAQAVDSGQSAGPKTSEAPEGTRPGGKPEATTTDGKQAQPDGEAVQPGGKQSPFDGRQAQSSGKAEASAAAERPETAQTDERPGVSATSKAATSTTAPTKADPAKSDPAKSDPAKGGSRAEGERAESALPAAEVDEGDTAPGGLPLPPSSPGRLVAGTPGGSTVPNLAKPTPPAAKGNDASATKQPKEDENAASRETQRLRPPAGLTPAAGTDVSTPGRGSTTSTPAPGSSTPASGSNAAAPAPGSSTSAPGSGASTRGREAEPERPSGGARPARSGGGWFDRAESPANEPVEPEATAPGRAGPPVASGPTPPSSGTAGASGPEKGESANETVRLERPAIVKVIGGTRRFHSSSCPLVRAAEASGVRSMPQSEAEAKGLTPCSVCMHDHQTVG